LTNWSNYGKSQGEEGLLKKIADIEIKKSGLDLGPENVLITAGSQQGIYITFEAFAGKGIAVGMPTYLGIMAPLQKFANNNIFPVTIDENGMNTKELDDVLRKNPDIKAIYVIPHGQNPAGVRLSIERRSELLEIAKDRKAIILEDDPYSGTAKNPLRPIYSFDKEGGNVIYMSTISKQLFAGRLGYMIADSRHIEHFTPEISGSILHVPKLIQYATLGMINKIEQTYGSYAEYLRLEVAEHYGRKRKDFGRALDKHFGSLEGITWNQPEEGLFYWVEFPEGTDTEELYELAKNEFGVVFVPGAAFDPLFSSKNSDYVSPIRNCARLNFSMPSAQEMDEGLEKLAQAYQEISS